MKIAATRELSGPWKLYSVQVQESARWLAIGCEGVWIFVSRALEFLEWLRRKSPEGRVIEFFGVPENRGLTREETLVLRALGELLGLEYAEERGFMPRLTFIVPVDWNSYRKNATELCHELTYMQATGGHERWK